MAQLPRPQAAGTKKRGPEAALSRVPHRAENSWNYFRGSLVVLLDDVALLPVAVPLLVAPEVVPEVVPDVVPVAEPVPEAEPEIEPDALTPALALVVSDGVVVAALEDERSTDWALLVELVAAESAAVSVPEVLVFVSTEQPVTPRAIAKSADAPIRLYLFFFMVFPKGWSCRGA